MNKEDIRRLQESDRRFIWHPFTQMREWTREAPVIIAEGSGCRLKDTEGREYIDGVSSLWVNIHGHRRAEIDLAVKDQIDRISHSTLLGLANVPSILLAERLVLLLRRSFEGVKGPIPSKVFYSDNGSTAVEVALKMAFQYWAHRGVEGRHKFMSLNNAYHGDTLGAVSVGGVDIFHKAFGPLLFQTFKAPSPYCYRCELGLTNPECGLACLGRAEEILRERHDEIAAVILEPLVQAAGGMIVFPEGYLRGMREICTRYNVLMIADEVATGFGRTGKMFACEHESVAPDLICLSKGITGGYLPLGVTVATSEIYGAFLGEFSELRTFFHGHSFTGNQLACAAALASLDIFEKDGTLKLLSPKIRLLQDRLNRIADMPHVGEARSKGLMAGVELVKDKAAKEPYPWEEKRGWRVAHGCMKRGVFIRPLGNVVVIMPPLCISEADLGLMLDAIEGSIAEAS